MATYQFSALAGGQAISFNPNTDVLVFDQTNIAAADIRAVAEGANLRVSWFNSGKDILLTNVSPLQVSTTNITFADGSRLLFGDNTTGTANDNAANAVSGGGGNDQLAGFGGNDTLNGGTGNDIYFVTAGDVLVDAGGVDTVVTDVNWTLAAGFENLEMTGPGNLQVQGNGGDNYVRGNSGNNYFNLRAGNDTIDAGAGNDTIDMSTGGTSSYGNDLIMGGDGIDTVDFDGYARSGLDADLANRFVRGGGAGAGEGFAEVMGVERFIGGAFNDRIVGGSTAEYLDGRGGSDTIDGGAGNDTLIGGAGADTLLFTASPGSANADQVTGFVSASDKLVLDGVAHGGIGSSGAFAAGDARFWSSASGTAHDADDRVIYNTTNGQLWYDADGTGSGAAQLVATLQGAPTLAASDIAVINGSSHIVGTAGDDTLQGTPGNDTLDGLGGNDSLTGADGHDLVRGGDGNDTLWGHDASDPKFGDDDREDTLDGGLGDDVYHVRGDFFLGRGDTILADPGGVDTVHSYASAWTLGSGLENLYFHNDSFARGTGNELDNVIHAGGAEGADIRGMAGNDVLTSAAFGGSTLDGGDGNDTLNGSTHGDLLLGGTGDDVLDGSSFGADDVLTGGTGADAFVFRGGDGLPSEITDFASGADKIRLDGTDFAGMGFGSIGPSGNFAAGDARFWSSASGTAHDASDRVIYNTSTGELWYDADGSGAGDARQIAVLQGAPALTATDIEVVNGSTSPGGEHIVGTAGDDSLTGSGGDDTLEGLGGNDTLRGEGGADVIDGGAGNDYLQGGRQSDGDAADYFIGGEGNDTLDGDSASFSEAEPDVETMDGGLGDDLFIVDNAADVLIDAGGLDTVRAFNMDWTLGAGFENLEAFNGELESSITGIGNELNNLMTTTWQARFEGRGGNDTLVGNSKEDTLFGDDGDDLLDGADRNDFLEGGVGNDTLLGNWEDDVLSGGAGNDWLYGDGGFFGGNTSDRDTLTGGTGADSFVFDGRTGSLGADTITDFVSGQDGLRFDATHMPELGASGRFAAGDGRFHAAAGATSGHDADDRLIYDTSTRTLYFDADGSGSQEAYRVVTLQPGASLAATDITIDNGTNGSHLVGTAGDDSLVGSEGDDTLEGLAGNDTLIGGAGNDQIIGSDPGDPFRNEGDSMQGGAGDDTLHSSRRSDTLEGGAGADQFLFEGQFINGIASSATVTDFAGGVDEIAFDAAVFTHLGGAGDFSIGDGRFYAAAGAFAGHDANDRIIYDTSTGTLSYDADGNGSGVAVQIATLSGAPSLAATDIAVVGSAPALIIGTEGDDTLNGTVGEDTIDGGTGNDVINGDEGTDLLIGGHGDDTLNAPAWAHGDGWADTLEGGFGNDEYWVSDDGDVIVPDNGGIDTVNAVNAPWTLGAGLENLNLIDTVGSGQEGTGNELDNVITASSGSSLHGMGGNDLLKASGSLEGGEGNDTLNGAGELSGGAGDDRFVFYPVFDYDSTRITDFATGGDKVVLDGEFGDANVGASGNFSAGDARFWSSTTGTAHDASDRVIYNTVTGELWYDADGSGSGGANRLAVLDGAPAFAATDIEVVNGNSGPNVINGTEGDDFITGTSGDDLIDARGGNDGIAPGEGNDTVFGGAGHDAVSLEGAYGNDQLDGGDGFDAIVMGAGATSGIVASFSAGTLTGGGAGSVTFTNFELVSGTAFNDRIDASGMTVVVQLDGMGGNDTLIGGEAGDELNGWEGDDYFVGGAGNDTIDGFNHQKGGSDTMDGGAGDDNYYVETGDVIVDSTGVDTVFAQMSWTLDANTENLTFWNTTFDEGLHGLHGTGNDRNNVIDGRGGDGVVYDGRGGNDTLIGSVLADTMEGGAGNDQYVVSTGDLLIENPGNGIDTVRSNVSWTLGDNFENLILDPGAITANGNGLNNVLTGNDASNSSINGRAGNDTMFGMAGNDTFDMSTGGTSSYGNDVIDGGAGVDSVEFGANARSGVTVNLAAGTMSGGGDAGTGGATLTSIENALGGNFNDSLIGDGGANFFRGSAGNDTLNGGAGNDRLNGGAGNDFFVFAAAPGSANSDVVEDFATGVDKLQMDDAVMSAIGATGNFAAGDVRFWAAAGATSGHDANDRVIYNSSTGSLYYDADGNGAGAAQLIATIQGHPAVGATDIAVI